MDAANKSEGVSFLRKMKINLFILQINKGTPSNFVFGIEF